MNTYSEAFKKEAVRLLSVSGKPVAPVARELGIRKSVLYRWRDEYMGIEVRPRGPSNKKYNVFAREFVGWRWRRRGVRF